MTLEEASSNDSSSVSDLGSQSDMKTRLSAKRHREEGFDELVTLLYGNWFPGKKLMY